MSNASLVVAAFDFDGTLTTTDSVVPFLRRLSTARSLARSFRYAPSAVVGAVRRDRDRLRAAATVAVLKGLPLALVDAEAAEFANEIVAQRLRPDSTARLEWHRQQGHRVVLVSASYEVYLDHLAAPLGVDSVLATRIEVVDGICTGRLDGPNCRGPEKVARVHQWLADQGLSRDDVDLWAYGDSSGDDELLDDADHPVRVDGVTITVAPGRTEPAEPTEPTEPVEPGRRDQETP